MVIRGEEVGVWKAGEGVSEVMGSRAFARREQYGQRTSKSTESG